MARGRSGSAGPAHYPLSPIPCSLLQQVTDLREQLHVGRRRGGRGRHIDWAAVDRLRPFGGIRIEDDVACTAGAPENLTRDAFAAVGG